jgi:hypothetical protein
MAIRLSVGFLAIFSLSVVSAFKNPLNQGPVPLSDIDLSVFGHIVQPVSNARLSADLLTTILGINSVIDCMHFLMSSKALC